MKFGNCIMTVNEDFFSFSLQALKISQSYHFDTDLHSLLLMSLCYSIFILSCICEVIYTLSIMISLLSINCHYMCVCCSTLCTSIQTISVCSIPVIHALSSHSYICVIKLDDLFSVYQTPYILYSGVLYTHFSIILGRNFLSSIVIL